MRAPTAPDYNPESHHTGAVVPPVNCRGSSIWGRFAISGSCCRAASTAGVGGVGVLNFLSRAARASFSPRAGRNTGGLRPPFFLCGERRCEASAMDEGAYPPRSESRRSESRKSPLTLASLDLSPHAGRGFPITPPPPFAARSRSSTAVPIHGRTKRRYWHKIRRACPPLARGTAAPPLRSRRSSAYR